MKYFVAIGEQETEVVVDGDSVAVDGRSYAAGLSAVAGTPIRQLLVDGKPVPMAVQPSGRGRWTLTIKGEHFDVEVVDERIRHIRRLVNDGAARQTAGAIRAPMPGLVVRVPVTVGQQITAGASVVVLEAMKMENELRAPAAGTVRSVLVEPGQTVDKGEVLVELE